MRISDWSSDVCSSDLCLALIEHKRLRVEDPPSVTHMGVDANRGRVASWILSGLPHPLGGFHAHHVGRRQVRARSEEHTSELQSLMRISYAVFCLKKKKKLNHHTIHHRRSK